LRPMASTTTFTPLRRQTGNILCSSDCSVSMQENSSAVLVIPNENLHLKTGQCNRVVKWEHYFMANITDTCAFIRSHKVWVSLRGNFQFPWLLN
jgi:hypothetical protein